MVLKRLELQHFRNYSKAAFDFDPHATVLVGQNAVGKTNLIEAIYLVATGKSFKSEKEGQLLQFGSSVTRVKAVLESEASSVPDAGPVGKHPTPTASLAGAQSRRSSGGPIPATRSAASEEQRVAPEGRLPAARNAESTGGKEPGTGPASEYEEELEVTLAQSETGYLQRKYLVNGVSKRRVDFASHLFVVLFTPLDLDIVLGQPSVRRNFLNEILEQTDQEYRSAFAVYTKALRQRNALLEQVQKSGFRDEERFAYWDELLITNGQLITRKRQDLIGYINGQDKQLFQFTLEYDKSTISEERLIQYKQAEVGAGVTLVGPQRDDVFISTFHEGSRSMEAVKHFCSRGQQRLVALELKRTQISYMQQQAGVQPLLLLDDIFSELDSSHIDLVMAMIGENQTIMTTTHREFISEKGVARPLVVELEEEIKSQKSKIKSST
jgi:DNA replication and repair protein RecF